jgi:hypothetical protein
MEGKIHLRGTRSGSSKEWGFEPNGGINKKDLGREPTLDLRYYTANEGV